MKYRIKVIPKSSKNEVILLGPDELKVKLTAAPVDGKANVALVKVLADHFKVKARHIRIISGATGRTKLVEIDSL